SLPVRGCPSSSAWSDFLCDTWVWLVSLRLVHSSKSYLNRGHRSSGGVDLKASANRWCRVGSTGRCLTVVLAGYTPSWLPPFQSWVGRMGRGQKPPPQFGQTFVQDVSTHERQNVHSNEQIIASV